MVRVRFPVLVEPFAAPEIFASGLGAVHMIGGGAGCLAFYRNAVPIGDPGPLERRVVVHLIMPTEAIADTAEKILATREEPAHAPAGTVAARTAGTDSPEYFATDMKIQCEPEFVRLLFYSDRGAVSVVMPPATFHRIASQIAIGPDRAMH